MKIGLRLVSFSMIIAACAAAGLAQAPQGQTPAGQSVWAAPAQPGVQSTTPSACGNQPLCYDSQDFAVAVVDFRMSLSSGFKVMDATLRFVNKTNQPLILGYVDGSAVALDDQGNRYNPYGNRNLAGIGIVNGNSGDPKFTLQAGGAGDARWELIWRPGAQDPVGSSFDLGMTIREMNTLVGGAHTLGAEVPLRFQGLANGMTGAAVAGAAAGAPGVAGVAGAAPMMSTGTSGLPPCGASATMTNVASAANSVGGQQTTAATTTATNTATGAASAISNLKSIFGKKNAATTPVTNVAGAAPCVPAATSAAMPVAAGTSTAPATAAGQVVTTTPATAKTATPTAATAKTTATPTATAARTTAAANAPNAAKPAVVSTTAPNTKPAVQPATATVKKPAPAKPAPAPAPANQTTNPPPKPTN